MKRWEYTITGGVMGLQIAGAAVAIWAQTWWSLIPYAATFVWAWLWITAVRRVERYRAWLTAANEREDRLHARLHAERWNGPVAASTAKNLEPPV